MGEGISDEYNERVLRLQAVYELLARDVRPHARAAARLVQAAYLTHHFQRRQNPLLIVL